LRKSSFFQRSKSGSLLNSIYFFRNMAFVKKQNLFQTKWIEVEQLVNIVKKEERREIAKSYGNCR